MNNLLKRAITGIIFVFIIIEGTLWTNWSFYGLWILVGILCLHEYYTLVKKATTFHKKTIPYILGTLYICIPIILLLRLDPRMVVTIMTIVWMNDTGAYLIGSAIGKHKMAPKISPKKSWEGFIGGAIFAIGTSYLWYTLLWSDPQRSIVPLFQNPTTQTILWIIFGLMIAITSVLGDLIESKFKRHIGVKDSGKLIPGHGGILDRFDAALFTLPFAWLFAIYLLG